MLCRQKNGNPVCIAILEPAAEAVLPIPPLTGACFFWSGNGRPVTTLRGWRRRGEHVYRPAYLKCNGRIMRAHTYILCHTFAPEEARQANYCKMFRHGWRTTGIKI